MCKKTNYPRYLAIASLGPTNLTDQVRTSWSQYRNFANCQALTLARLAGVEQIDRIPFYVNVPYYSSEASSSGQLEQEP